MEDNQINAATWCFEGLSVLAFHKNSNMNI